jgi:hypothetical protein
MKVNILKTTHLIPKHLVWKCPVIAHANTIQANILLIGVYHDRKVLRSTLCGV